VQSLMSDNWDNF